ncbi:MAG: hypothetical protein KIS78_28110 [Labilithrix sp.]|nr:hypothetical protein [Labilithrix sp.]MCW5836298.1 hypothetical protein [Labilithrix sp.]
MTRRRLLALSIAALAAILVVTPPRIARADDEPKQEELPRRQANFAWDKNDKTKQTLLRASFSSRDVIDKAMADKLASGLPTVIAMRAYLLREGEANPVALAVRTCRVVYDLWDEVYRLKISSAGGERDSAALNLEGVLRQCAEARDLPIADRALLTAGKPHFLGVIVEVNPVSPQMLAQMRQWVSRPAGSTGIGPGDALFGSFVGLFVRQIGNADRTLRFRTQSLTP